MAFPSPQLFKQKTPPSSSSPLPHLQLIGEVCQLYFQTTSQIQCIVPTTLILPKPKPAASSCWTAVTGWLLRSLLPLLLPTCTLLILYIATKEICFLNCTPDYINPPYLKHYQHDDRRSTTAWWIPDLPFPRLQGSLNSCFQGFCYSFLLGLSSLRSTQSWSHLFT